MCVDRYRRRHRLRMPSTVIGDGAPAIVWEGILQLQVMRDGAMAPTHRVLMRLLMAALGCAKTKRLGQV